MQITTETWEQSANLSDKFRIRMGLATGGKRHIDHLVIALAEEVGEISSLIKKAQVRDEEYPLLEILKELTDVQQYVIAMFESCSEHVGDSMDHFIQRKCDIVAARLDNGDGTSAAD